MPATHSDAETLVDSIAQAQLNLDAAGSDAKIEEAAADQGYHKLSTLELADDLERFLEHKPIKAKRPTLAERSAKWARRNRRRRHEDRPRLTCNHRAVPRIFCCK